MTVPAAGGTITLALGAPAVMLTEYAGGSDAPLYVINRSADLVWIAGDSSVGPSNGTPLEGFTSLPWSTPGQVWAVLDQAAAAAAQLVVSSSISDWQPSPTAIAAEVAAQLLATGIPSVIVAETVTLNDPIPAGQTKTYDVARYSQLIIVATANVTPHIEYRQLLPDGTLADIDLIYGPNGFPVRLACVGSQLTLTNQHPTDTVTVTVQGSNRSQPERMSVGASDALGLGGDAGPDTYTLGQQVDLTGGLGTFNQIVSGACVGYFRATGGVGLRFLLTMPNATTVTLCDTAEMHTISNGSLFLARGLALPRAPYGIVADVTVAGTGSFGHRIIKS